MAGKVITDFIKLQMYKKGGAIATDKAVQFAANALEKRLINLGIDPSTLNNQTQLKQLLAYVKQAEDAAFNQMNVLSGKDAENALKKFMGQDTSADVFDLTGNKLDPNKPIMGGTQGIETLLKKGDITKGTVTKKSDKVKEREMFKEANERFNQTDIVADTIARITSMEPVTALKEANKIIKREGIYKNLNKDQSQAILKGTDDWIHQRDLSDRYDYKNNRPFRDDPDFDPDDPDYIQRMKDEDAPDFAKGGRAKHYTGGIVDVEPNLSDIGHGADALMARTRLLSPNNQATTSTGLNYLLAEDNDNMRVPFRVGKTAKKNKKKKKKSPSMFELMTMIPEMSFREPVNFPYKSLEDIPPNVLAMLRKDPNFDLQTFLTKVGFSDPDKTRIQEKMRGEVSSGIYKGKKDEPWGLYSPMSDTSFLNYQQFGKSEPIAGGLLSIKSPSDADKVQTILHEMRHARMKDPFFMKSSAVPKWVREYEEAGKPHYLDADIKDAYKKFRDTQKDVSGEELYVRFMDQYFGDVAEKGTIAGSDYKPYFDKILKDEWTPYAKRYEEILKEEKRVKDKPYGLAEGGRIGFKSGTDLKGRAFLKVMAALTGGVGAIKSGILGIAGKEAPAQVTKEVVKQAAPDVPPHFLKLVEQITKFGDDTIATQDKVIAKKYKDYYMEKDFAGNIEITKTKTGANEFGEGPIEEVYMKYTAPDDALPNNKDTVVRRGDYEEFTARPDMEGKMKDVEGGVPDDIIEEVMSMDDIIINKAEGGRIGFSAGKSLAKLLADKTITGSSRRFLEKVFGKESFERMIENDPELYRGLLETVEMFRKKDKEGLKMYMQKFLPHMDDETVEEFIIGSNPDIQGIQGQLLRLGSGRDYAGKIEMMKNADQMKKLSDLEITDEMVRKPNASGGIAKLLGE